MLLFFFRDKPLIPGKWTFGSHGWVEIKEKFFRADGVDILYHSLEIGRKSFSYYMTRNVLL